MRGTYGDGPSFKTALKHGNTVDAVANVIKTGVPGTMMPPSGLADGQNREPAQHPRLSALIGGQWF